MYSHLSLNGGRFLHGDQHSYPLFFMRCACKYVTVTLPVTIIWYETLVVFVSSGGYDYLVTFYRNLFDMCYSMDNEQEENEQKKVRLKTFINWRASCKKGVYRILVNFHFLQDWANFWQTDLLWHEKHRSVIVSVNLRFVLQK